MPADIVRIGSTAHAASTSLDTSIVPPPPPSPARSALLAEGLHSMADVANQMLLKQGVIRSRRKPTPEHQYGFHKEKYVYALISGKCSATVPQCRPACAGGRARLDSALDCGGCEGIWVVAKGPLPEQPGLGTSPAQTLCSTPLPLLQPPACSA